MDTFFKYLNLFPLPLWAAMIIAPHHPLTERCSRASTIFGFTALHYVIALIIAVKIGSRERVGSDASGKLNVTSLEGIQGLLRTRSGTLAAWAHMLALDLFTGAWIYRQCRRLYAPDWVRVISLFLTFANGPVGLLIFLFWRVTGAKEGEALAKDA